jgi:hypothetical protein
MNYKTCILVICTVSVAHCQNNANPLMGLLSKFGGGLGGTGSGSGGSGSGGGLFNVLGQLGIGNALGSSQREREFNELLDASYNRCTAKGARLTNTERTCPDTPTLTRLIRERIPGELRTLARHVQKNQEVFGSYNATLRHCEARANDSCVSWSDLNKFMTAKGPGSWQATPATKREWQGTVTECGKLIAAERAECNRAMSILCAFSEGDHFACRPVASLKRPPNPPNANRAACDRIVQKLRTDELRERERQAEAEAEANNERFW